MTDEDYAQVRSALQVLAAAVAEKTGDRDGLARAIQALTPAGPIRTCAHLCAAMAHAAKTGQVTSPAQPFKPGDPF